MMCADMIDTYDEGGARSATKFLEISSTGSYLSYCNEVEREVKRQIHGEVVMLDDECARG